MEIIGKIESDWKYDGVSNSRIDTGPPSVTGTRQGRNMVHTLVIELLYIDLGRLADRQ